MPNFSDPACAFCKIAARQDSSAILVAEGSDWVAFFPDVPATVGHTLIVPRRHIVDFLELDPGLAAELMRTARAIGLAIRAALDPQGLNMVTSAGPAAEQTVFHLHLHVLPRWYGDGIKLWPESSRRRTPAKLREAASEIQRALAAMEPG